MSPYKQKLEKIKQKSQVQKQKNAASRYRVRQFRVQEKEKIKN